jgi:hypothetical protein
MADNTGRGALNYAASLALFALGFLGVCALIAPAEEPMPYDSAAASANGVETPETVIENWPGRPRATALALIAKYGEPSRFTNNDLVWFKNGPWRKTVVYRYAPQGFLHGRNILEQSITYAVPPGKVAALQEFDGGIKFDKKGGELTSRAESEGLNFLVLNLADEIVTDKRSPDEAREFYRKTVKLSESGKSSAYMGGFIFPLADDDSSTLDPQLNPDLEPNPVEGPHESGLPEPMMPPPNP